MPEEPSNQPAAVGYLAELAIKVLKPGGVTAGGAYGLWLLFIEHKAAEAIAASLIGFCFSYAVKLLEPIHVGNQRRLEAMGKAIDHSIEDSIEQLFAKATRAEDTYLLCQALDCRDYKPEGMGARDRTSIPMLQQVFVPLELDSGSIAAGLQFRDQRDVDGFQGHRIWDFLAKAKGEPAFRQMAIVAWGGFGKTTLLKHLAYIYGMKQQAKFQVPFFVPVLLPLRKYRSLFTQEQPPSLPELVMQHHVQELSELNPRLLNLPSNWFQELLTKGDALVMMDGFDEIPEAERSGLSRWISAQMRRFDRSVFILTSRPAAYKEDFVEPLRTKFWVRPFNDQQQEDFLRQWYFCQEKLDRGGRNSPEVQREAALNAGNLLSQIRNPDRPELADLAKNPLLLNLLATYHRSEPGADLPRQRAELYQDIVTLQLRKRPDARNIVMPLSPQDRQNVLQGVALQMMQRGIRLIPEDELLGILALELQAENHAVAPNEFLKQIIAVSELIVRQGLEGCEFSHLSFQEFLAAAQIKALKQEDLLYPYLKDADRDSKAWWRQTIFLYAAQTNPTGLIKEALNQGATDLAYACWQTSRRSLDAAFEAELLSLKPAIATSRYAKLEEELKAGEWKAADTETYRLMITTVGKEEGQWFEREELLNFPCEELLAIDGLWVKYSNGQFGFSVQKKIYLDDCGGIADGQYHREAWYKFCHKVGWKVNNEYVDVKYNTSSPPGHLPLEWGEGMLVLMDALFSRIETCKL